MNLVTESYEFKYTFGCHHGGNVQDFRWLCKVPTMAVPGQEFIMVSAAHSFTILVFRMMEEMYCKPGQRFQSLYNTEK